MVYILSAILLCWLLHYFSSGKLGVGKLSLRGLRVEYILPLFIYF
jgi:hypothetical protein